MSLQILPMAITMMAGPQIMSAIIFVTNPAAVRVSLSFLAGVAIATTVGVGVMLGIATMLGGVFDLGDPSQAGSLGNIVQYTLVGLLIAAAVKNYVRRETIEPPKWLGALMEANAKKAFRAGLLLIFVMPSDLIVMLTVGTNLSHNDLPFTAALPFIGATILIAALPLLAFLIFHRRAIRAMPKARDWMNTHSWLVNIIVCGVFIYLIASA